MLPSVRWRLSVKAEGRADKAYPGYARTYRASRRSEPSTIFSTLEPFGQATVASRRSYFLVQYPDAKSRIMPSALIPKKKGHRVRAEVRTFSSFVGSDR